MRTTAEIFHVHISKSVFKYKVGTFHYTLQPLKGVAFDVKGLCIYCVPLRKTQNCDNFSVSLRAVILVSIDCTSSSHNASMSLIQYLVSLQFGYKVTNCRIFRNRKST